MRLSNILVAAGVISISAASQISLSTPFGSDYPSKCTSDDAEICSPIEDLRSLPSTEFTTLLHPDLPDYSVRIKQNGGAWCDETVRSYTGYIDIGARHLFFLFFESRNDPKTDDIMLWINGGPGGSSALGLLQEMGPCNLKDENTTEFNPYSWNSHANIFFLDQPIGVGFSYAEYGEYVDNTYDAAKDVAAFMRIFFDTFTEFQGRPFHLSGESYAGRYLPVFAAAIYDENKKAVAEGWGLINLSSVIIGNGCTDNPRMVVSYYDIQCTGASIPPIQDISSCVRMKKAVPRCESMLKNHCINIYDEMGCTAAIAFCHNEIQTPFEKLGRNIYDVSKHCDKEAAGDEYCLGEQGFIETFFNNDTLREYLGVDPEAGEYKVFSPVVGSLFSTDIDMFQPTHFYVTELLERGVKFLIFAGTYDMICNWVGNDRFTRALEWSGQEEFVSKPLRPWMVDGNVVGETRGAKGLSFTTIYGAGHMAPGDKPKESLEMLSRWLKGEEF